MRSTTVWALLATLYWGGMAVLYVLTAFSWLAILASAGYEVVAGGAPKSFVAVDADGRQIDVHPVVFDDARGGGVYQTDDGDEWVYPSAGFIGHGSVAGYRLRCLSADAQVLVHDGYELTDKDYRELYLLHERFGVELPTKYAERALATSRP